MSLPLDILIIGGTGFYQLPDLNPDDSRLLTTPFGDTSAPIQCGLWAGRRVGFLARHGLHHQCLPHQVNYRANIYAAHLLKAHTIIAINTTGSLNASFVPGSLVLPDQIIDYTWGREQTFATGLELAEKHIDFTHPYSESLRQGLAQAAPEGMLAGLGATYAATQGPRLESAAEIRRLERDGCDLVGMTAMPEAALARELGLPLASIAVVANWAAGFGPAGPITMDAIMRNISVGQKQVHQLLDCWLKSTSAATPIREGAPGVD